jgi:hypothetical protein
VPHGNPDAHGHETTADVLNRHAEELCGSNVIALDGDVVGSVDDVVRGGTDDRPFLVVGGSRFLGIGRRAFLVPVEAILWLDEEGILIGETRLRMTGGPPYEPDLVPDVDYFAQACAYYSVRRRTRPSSVPRASGRVVSGQSG